MTTYKNATKEKTRFLVWDHAVESLTTKREDSRILNKSYVKNLWQYCFQDYIIKYGFALDSKNAYLQNWLSFSDICYSTKTPQDLKIAFFCGPEPENDVDHLIRLGVRIENIYAFEGNSKLFTEAMKSLNETYPTLKIFNGQIQDFVKANFLTFDIIYLDFTKSLLDNATFQVFCDIIDSNSLSNLGIIAINTCYPEKNQDNIQFLTNYFYFQEFIEYSVLKEENDINEEDNSGRFIENCECYGYDIFKTKELVDTNFEGAYSAFQTSLIINYTNHIKPFWCALNKKFIRERLLDISPDKLERFGSFPEFQKEVGKVQSIDDILQMFYSNYESSVYLEPYSYSLYHFIHSIKEGSNSSWKNFFSQKGSGNYNREQAIISFYCFLDSVSQSGIEYLSDTFKDEISNIHNNLVGAEEGLFCDVPMIHLWLELAIYQLGYPYHQNTKNHKRYSYIAKTNKMCLDIFTFDQCRALYDWLPMVEYYGSDLKILERQIMTRICMDSIKKHNLHILGKLYFGAALIGLYEREWAINHYFMDRQYLNK